MVLQKPRTAVAVAVDLVSSVQYHVDDPIDALSEIETLVSCLIKFNDPLHF